jgi:RNA polymerase sigma-70 factor (ECF subfamily)
MIFGTEIKAAPTHIAQAVMTTSSRSILLRVADHEEAAVSECIQSYGALVWSIARRLSRTRADAEDAVQEVFMEIWRCAARFDPSRGTEAAFIATVARRRLIDRLRRARAQPLIDSDANIAEHPAESVDAASLEIDNEAAARAIASLRTEYAQVLNLAFCDGLTQQEISVHLGLPLGTVKSYMRRGLIQLRAHLAVDSESTVRNRRGPPVEKPLPRLTLDLATV